MTDIVSLFKAGKTLREIGKEIGVSHVTVKSRLEALDVEMNTRGRKPLVIAPEDVGLPQKDLMKKYNASKSGIYAALRRQKGEK